MIRLFSHVLAFILSVFLNVSALGLNNLDSLITEVESKSGKVKADELLDIAGRISVEDPTRSKELIDRTIIYSREIEYDLGLIKSWLLQAFLETRQGNYVTAEKLAIDALELAQETDNILEESKAQLTLGGSYLMTGDLAKSLELHIEGLENAKKANDTYLIANFLMNIGRIKYDLGDLESADSYWKQALDVLKAANAIASSGGIYINLGILEYERRNYGQSIKYNKRALEVIRKQNDKYQMGLCHYNIGFGHILLDEYEQAIPHLDTALQLRNEIGDQSGVAKVLLQQAKVAEAKRDFQKVASLVKHSNSIAEENDDWQLKKVIVEFLVSYYERTGSLQKALDAHKDLAVISDTLSVRANRVKIAELETKYKVDELRAQTELQQKEKEVAYLKVLQRNILVTALGIIVALLSMTFWVFRKKANKRLLDSQTDYLKSKEKTKELEEELAVERQKLIEFTDRMVMKSSNSESAMETVETHSKMRIDSNSERILTELNKGIVNDKDWISFNILFEAAYPDFSERFRTAFPDATRNHIRLVTLMKVQLSNKEIASILNISRESVIRAKYRLRQKMGLETNQELEDFLQKL